MKFLVFIPFILVFTAGCNPQDAANMQRDTSRIARDTTEAATNAQLVGRVGAVFTQLKSVDMSGIHLEAKNGTVILGGHVRSASQKAYMQKMAMEIRGVKAVVNHLRVIPVSQ